MEWKLLLSTFLSILIAELGDKTQLATFSLAAGSQSKLSVFLGASLALVASTLIAVTFGSMIGTLVNPLWVKRLAGTIFIILGVFYLVGK